MIGEELGLIGAAAVLALFVLLGIVGIRIALHAPDRFGLLLATGVTAWFCVQAFVNIGAVIGILPITGVPLPLVSFGGSSLVFTLTALGILINIGRQEKWPPLQEGAPARARPLLSGRSPMGAPLSDAPSVEHDCTDAAVPRPGP